MFVEMESSQRTGLEPLLPAGGIGVGTFELMAFSFASEIRTTFERLAEYWRLKSADHINKKAEGFVGALEKHVRARASYEREIKRVNSAETVRRADVDRRAANIALLGKYRKPRLCCLQPTDDTKMDLDLQLHLQNLAALKLVALEPKARSDLSYPKTVDDFSMLKSMGQGRLITKLSLHMDKTDPKKYRTLGIEVLYKGGISAYLGKAKSEEYEAITINEKEVRHLQAIKQGSNFNGKSRCIYAFDPEGNRIEKWLPIYSHAYPEASSKRHSLEGYDLIGLSLQTD